MSRPEVILFDALETLGSEVAASRRDRFKEFRVYPDARRIVERLAEQARIGVLCLDPGVELERLAERLAEGGLVPPIERGLVGVASGPGPFARFLRDHELQADRVLFVSLDAGQRARAIAEGLKVAPHAALAAAVLAGEPLQLARIEARDSEASWATLLREAEAVPLLLTREPGPVAYVIAPGSRLGAFAEAHGGGEIGVQNLAPFDAVAQSTLLLLQLTEGEATSDSALEEFLAGLHKGDFPLVKRIPDGWLVALPAHRSLDELHPPPAGAGHGHTRVLLPDASVLRVAARASERPAAALEANERERLEGLRAASFGRQLRSWFQRRGEGPR